MRPLVVCGQRCGAPTISWRVGAGCAAVGSSVSALAIALRCRSVRLPTVLVSLSGMALRNLRMRVRPQRFCDLSRSATVIVTASGGGLRTTWPTVTSRAPTCRLSSALARRTLLARCSATRCCGSVSVCGAMLAVVTAVPPSCVVRTYLCTISVTISRLKHKIFNKYVMNNKGNTRVPMREPARRPMLPAAEKGDQLGSLSLAQAADGLAGRANAPGWRPSWRATVAPLRWHSWFSSSRGANMGLMLHRSCLNCMHKRNQ